MYFATQIFLDTLPARVIKSRAHVHTPTHAPMYAHTRHAHTRPVRDTRKRTCTHAPTCAPLYAPTRAPRPCACACASDHTPRNAPVSLSEPLCDVFHPSPVCLPSQPVKRLTEPCRRLYSRSPVFCVQCSTLHSVDPPTLCKMPNREKMQKSA